MSKVRKTIRIETKGNSKANIVREPLFILNTSTTTKCNKQST